MSPYRLDAAGKVILITGATDSLNPYAGNAGDAVDMLAHGTRIAASGRSR